MHNYAKLANDARKKVLTMIHKAQTSHVASNFSIIDVATVLYENLTDDDIVIWSKGWASATAYYFMAQQGLIPKEDLERFAIEEDGKIEYMALLEPNINGVYIASGSMGHGLPVAVGRAMARKRLGLPGNVYCIMSDGELNEGSTWESAMEAYHHKLDNLVVFVDANKWQAMGKTKDVLDLEPIENRWRGFGWTSVRVDGHDCDMLDRAMHIAKNHGFTPISFICDTIKGKGVSFFEDHLLYHYKHIEKDEYDKAMKELNEKYA